MAFCHTVRHCFLDGRLSGHIRARSMTLRGHRTRTQLVAQYSSASSPLTVCSFVVRCMVGRYSCLVVMTAPLWFGMYGQQPLSKCSKRNTVPTCSASLFIRCVKHIRTLTVLIGFGSLFLWAFRGQVEPLLLTVSADKDVRVWQPGTLVWFSAFFLLYRVRSGN